MDDILITGKTEEDYLHTHEQILLKLYTHGFHLTKEKCAFLKSEVVFLGHKIDHRRIHPIDPTLDAITHAKVPSKVTELQKFYWHGKSLW